LNVGIVLLEIVVEKKQGINGGTRKKKGCSNAVYLTLFSPKHHLLFFFLVF
jgi:hypothetical protein